MYKSASKHNFMIRKIILLCLLALFNCKGFKLRRLRKDHDRSSSSQNYGGALSFYNKKLCSKIKCESSSEYNHLKKDYDICSDHGVKRKHHIKSSSSSSSHQEHRKKRIPRKPKYKEICLPICLPICPPRPRPCPPCPPPCPPRPRRRPCPPCPPPCPPRPRPRPCPPCPPYGFSNHGRHLNRSFQNDSSDFSGQSPLRNNPLRYNTVGFDASSRGYNRNYEAGNGDSDDFQNGQNPSYHAQDLNHSSYNGSNTQLKGGCSTGTCGSKFQLGVNPRYNPLKENDLNAKSTFKPFTEGNTTNEKIINELDLGSDGIPKGAIKNPKKTPAYEHSGLFTAASPIIAQYQAQSSELISDPCKKINCTAILKKLDQILIEKLTDQRYILNSSGKQLKQNLQDSLISTSIKIEQSIIDAAYTLSTTLSNIISQFNTDTTSQLLQAVNTNNTTLLSGVNALIASAESTLNTLIIDLAAQPDADIVTVVTDLTTSAGLLLQIQDIMNTLSTGVTTLFATQLPIFTNSVTNIMNTTTSQLSSDVLKALQANISTLINDIFAILADESASQAALVDAFINDLLIATESILIEYGSDVSNLIKCVFCYDVCGPQVYAGPTLGVPIRTVAGAADLGRLVKKALAERSNESILYSNLGGSMNTVSIPAAPLTPANATAVPIRLKAPL